MILGLDLLGFLVISEFVDLSKMRIDLDIDEKLKECYVIVT
jgi:hypothetical protein